MMVADASAALQMTRPVPSSVGNGSAACVGDVKARLGNVDTYK